MLLKIINGGRMKRQIKQEENKSLSPKNQTKLENIDSKNNFCSGSYPELEVSGTGKEICLSAEVPGLNDKDIHISFKNGSLFISGEKKGGHKESFDNFYY